MDQFTGERYPIATMTWDNPDDDFFALGDLCVQIYDAPVYGSGSTVVYRVKNVGNGAGGLKFEMKVTASSFDPDTLVSNPDGSLEVRICGRVYADGEDYSLIDPTSKPTSCKSGASGLDMHNKSGIGGARWLINLTECVYLDPNGYYCRENPDLLPGGIAGDCSPPGPGGSSFDGGADGDRVVRGGGAEPTYSPSAGNGTPATAADPADAQTLAAMTQPLISLDVTLCDDSVLSLAKVSIPRAGAAGSLPGVVGWGDVVYPYSDRCGNVPA